MPAVTRLPSPSKQIPAPADQAIRNVSIKAVKDTSVPVLRHNTPGLLTIQTSTRLQPSSPTKFGSASQPGSSTARVTQGSPEQDEPADKAQQQRVLVPMTFQQVGSGRSTFKQYRQAATPKVDEPHQVPHSSAIDAHTARSLRDYTPSHVSRISKLSKTVNQNVTMSSQSMPSGATQIAVSTPQPSRTTSRAALPTRSISASPRKPLSASIRTISTPDTATSTTPRSLHSPKNKALSSPLKQPQPQFPARAPFTTHQRSFSPPKACITPKTPNTLDPDTLRAQTHLLHLSLLHDSAAPVLAAYTASGQAQLRSLHSSLQALYTHVLVLERQTRQAENVLALHAWAGGNVNSIGRRLNVLCAVLKELMALSAPGGRKMTGYKARQNDPKRDAVVEEASTTLETRRSGSDLEKEGEQDAEEEQQGPYAHLIEAFTHWTEWVSSIWLARGQQDDKSTSTPTTFDRLHPPATQSPQLSSSITPVDPLGDSLKSSLRSLTTVLQSLSLKLSELPPFPASAAKSTPARLLALTKQLLEQMQEELQLIREIEFEVVVGEEAWMKRQLGVLSGAVEVGFITPRRG